MMIIDIKYMLKIMIDHITMFCLIYGVSNSPLLIVHNNPTVITIYNNLT